MALINSSLNNNKQEVGSASNSDDRSRTSSSNLISMGHFVPPQKFWENEDSEPKLQWQHWIHLFKANLITFGWDYASEERKLAAFHSSIGTAALKMS